MEKATSSLRRGGAMLWSIGVGYPDLNLIISELKNLRSHTKAIRDSQQTVLQDMTNWACNAESRALKEVFVHLLDLNALWYEVQTQFADHINDFKHQFEMILEGEKGIDAAKTKFADCEVAEQKARKKLKKIQKREVQGDVVSVVTKVDECQRQREIAQTEVAEKVKENEAVKLIRMKEGLLKLSEAYLALSHKCIYIFEAQRDITNCLPDVQDKEIHEVRFDGLMGAKDILVRARERVKNYRRSSVGGGRGSELSSPHQRHGDPPPPYSASPYYPPPPFNVYYTPPGSQTGRSDRDQPDQQTPNMENEPRNSLYPNVVNDEELASAMNAAAIRHDNK